MSFRDNLQYLRASRNMTQEQLALLLGVSRQSVTKWEAQRAYPEMDKLIKICDIFGCTLDDLVKGDVRGKDQSPLEGDAHPENTIPGHEAVIKEDVFGYDEHMRSFAWRIATGVFSILMGIAACMALEAWIGGGSNSGIHAPSSEGPSAIAVLAGILIGLAFIIPASMKHDRFVKAHPHIPDFYTQSQHDESGKALGRGIVGGIGFILVGISLMVAFADTSYENEVVAVFLALIACGVWLFVRFGIMHGRLNLVEYNREATETLSQYLSDEQIAAIEDPHQRAAITAEKRAGKISGAVCGIIMLVATIIALLLLFVPLGLEGAPSSGMSGWEPSGATLFFWLPWPIGGILCGIACLIIRLVVKER